MSIYAALASEYGGVDASDKEAVNNFFEKDVYDLPEDIRLEIIEKLFAGMDSSDGFAPECLEDDTEDLTIPSPSNYKRADKS